MSTGASTLRGLYLSHESAWRWPHLTALGLATELNILILPNNVANRPELLRVLRSCRARMVWARNVGADQLGAFQEALGAVLGQHSSFWPRLSHVTYNINIVPGQRPFGSFSGRRITEGDTPWHKYPVNFAPWGQLDRSAFFKVSSPFLA